MPKAWYNTESIYFLDPKSFETVLYPVSVFQSQSEVVAVKMSCIRHEKDACRPEPGSNKHQWECEGGPGSHTKSNMVPPLMDRDA